MVEPADQKPRYTKTCLGALAFMILFPAIVGGIALWIGSRSLTAMLGPSAPDPTVEWDGSSPYVCDGPVNQRIQGTHATFATGAAVTVSGACDLELVDVHLSAPVAIAASSGNVVVNQSEITGSVHAIEASGSAFVTLSLTTVHGSVQQTDHAYVNVGPAH